MAKTAKTYHHGDLRNALIQAGLDILSTDGVEALTLREVARRAGVSHSAPYAHFADKEALLAAIAQQGFERLAEETARAEQKRSADPSVTLAESAWAYVRFALAHPHHMRLMFSGLVSRTESERAPLARAAEDTLSVLEGAVRSAQAQGKLKPEHTPLMVLTAWALAHGLATLMIEDQLPASLAKGSPEKLTRACAELLLDGLRQR
jgi:AcrR family transcriptional regulator